MNTLTRYRCEHCGKSFSDKEKCAEHEATHLLAGDMVIRSVTYTKEGKYDNYGPWPTEVTLAAADSSGREASFYFNYAKDAE